MKKSENLHEDKVIEKNKGSLIRTLLLFTAVLIMALVMINSMVTARVPLYMGNDETGNFSKLRPACSCCSGNQAESVLDQVRLQALTYYNENFEEKATDAVVEDYGCHQEILIFKDGKLLGRLAYNNGVFNDLGLFTGEQVNWQ